MGSDTFSLPIFDAMLRHGSELSVPVETVGLVTQPDRPAGRGRALSANIVKERALEIGVPVLQPERVRDPSALEAIIDLRPDVIVVASFGQILPRSLLDAPRRKAINLHPSLLPMYRGPSPITAPVLAGDRVTGTTLMVMTAKMDAGPILDQIETPIGAEETGGELRDRLAALSAELLLRDLPAWLRGEIEPREQDETAATYTRLLGRGDYRVDWSGSSEEVARRVRAFSPRPAAFTEWNGSPVRIFQARPAEGDGPPGAVIGEQQDGILVACGQGAVLIERLQLPGGRPMSSRDVVRGHRELLQAVFGGGA